MSNFCSSQTHKKQNNHSYDNENHSSYSEGENQNHIVIVLRMLDFWAGVSPFLCCVITVDHADYASNHGNVYY